MGKSFGSYRAKKFGMLTKYYLRASAKYLLSRLGFLLFLLSFALFAYISYSSIYEGGAIGTRTLKLEGAVSEAIRQDSLRVEIRPVAGATVSVGGFRVVTDATGGFSLNFLSSRANDIPVVIESGGDPVVRRVSFEAGRKSLRQDFLIR